MPGVFTGSLTTRLNLGHLENISPIDTTHMFCPRGQIITGSYHQGVASDGENLYIFHSTETTKLDKNLEVATINTHVNEDCGVSHLVDGDVYDGIIYQGGLNWPYPYTCAGAWGNAHMIYWDADDLSYIGKTDVSDKNAAIAAMAIDGPNGIIWWPDYCDGTKLYKYDLEDKTYIGTLALGTTVLNIQGITYKESTGLLYISKSNLLYSVNPTSGVVTKIGYAANVSPYYSWVNEGIDYTTEAMYMLFDDLVTPSRVTWGTIVPIRRTFEFVYRSNVPMASLIQNHSKVFDTTSQKIEIYFDKVDKQLKFRTVHDDASDTPEAVIGESDLPLRKLHHIVAVDSISKLYLYLDGILKSEVDRTGTALDSTHVTYFLGCAQNSSPPQHELYFFKVYNSALSADEVSQKYKEWMTNTQSPDYRCLGWWDLRPNDTGKLRDKSGYHNHGFVDGNGYTYREEDFARLEEI